MKASATPEASARVVHCRAAHVHVSSHDDSAYACNNAILSRRIALNEHRRAKLSHLLERPHIGCLDARFA